MSAYSGLPTEIAVAAARLDDAISSLERVNGCGYTLILVPMDPRIPMLVSLDGKPIPIDPREALDAALNLRKEVAAG